MSFFEFLLEYYVWLVTVLVILIIGIIGFIVDSIQSNKSKEVDNNNLSKEVESNAPVNKKTLFKRKNKSNSAVDLKSLENNEPLVLEDTIEDLGNSNVVDGVDLEQSLVTRNVVDNNFEQKEVLNNNQTKKEDIFSGFDMATFDIPLKVDSVVYEDVNYGPGGGVTDNKIDNSNVGFSLDTSVVTNNNGTFQQVTDKQTNSSPSVYSLNINNGIPVRDVMTINNVSQNKTLENTSNVNSNTVSQSVQIATSVMPQQVVASPSTNTLFSNPNVQDGLLQNKIVSVNSNVNVGVNNNVQNNNVGLNNQIVNTQVVQPVGSTFDNVSQSVGVNIQNNMVGGNLSNNVINPSVVTTTVGAQPFDISSMFANNN